MRESMIPMAEITQRITLLRNRLVEQGVDGALFVHPVDIYYYTGTRQNGALWMPASGAPLLLVRKSFTRAAEEAMIPDVRPFPPSRELVGLFPPEIVRIGLTYDVMPLQYYKYYTAVLEGREFIDISLMNRELRSVKSAWELERMRESGRRLAEVFSRIPLFLRPGMRELDLAAGIEQRLRQAGHEGSIRLRAFGQEIVGLTSSGGRAAYPGGFDGPVTGQGISPAAPYGPSEAAIAMNQPVIVDYSGTFGGYTTDMTRIFVCGQLDPALSNAFSIALEIQSWLAERLRPGMICEDLYLGALRIAEEAGLGEQFMGYKGEQAKFVGHGVGLELDELPILAKGFTSQLQAGQTIAVEPKFIFPGHGVVGIENTFAVTDSGGEKLTTLPDAIMCQLSLLSPEQDEI